MDARVEDVVARCEALFEDVALESVRAWKAEREGRRAVGYMPIYVPREILHAAGVLPVGVYGGGDRIEVIQGDAYYQSYICRIPRSTLELGLTGRLAALDGMLFPSTCDVIRNLSGMWRVMFPERYVRYVDVPQDYSDAVGGVFWRRELASLREEMESLTGARVTDDALRASIAAYNDNREALRALYTLRAQRPWQAPTVELYLLLRAGLVLPVEAHTTLVRQYIAAAQRAPRQRRDNARVVLTGTFCEQPPLGLIKSIEMAGCYIVDDDFLLTLRWLQGDVSTEGDPLESLARAFLHASVQTSSRYDERREDKGRGLLEQVRTRGAEGVIFAAPSFCDPALLERPMLQEVLAAHGVPYTAFKYAENTGQLAPIREQAGTFADSIKLWGAA